MADKKSRQGNSGDQKDRKNFEGPVPSPYNFVPLNDHVVFPDWSHLVSQDVPFKDGLSGTIDLEIEAKTPIYIRNGGDHPADRHHPDYTDFFKMSPDGPYAIPGTSIKGMIRNVMEIITKGKMRTSDRRYAVRDLNNPNRDLYGGWMTTNKPPFKSKPKAGWLELGNNGDWRLKPCKFVRVERKALIEHFKGSYPEFEVPQLHNRQKSTKKYESWGKERLAVGFSFKARHLHKTSRDIQLEYPKVTQLLSPDANQAEHVGTIVFTGQPMADVSLCGHKSGQKHMEFIFYDEENNSFPVPDQIRKDFVFIHSNDERNPNGALSPNEEWDYWKKTLNSGGRVPIFYLAFRNKDPSPTDDSVSISGNGACLHSMGLALMYRLAYKYRTSDLLRRTGQNAPHQSCEMDFAETLFGRIADSGSLKGRIQFESAGITSHGTKVREKNPVDLVLGSPKPSFYPNYIRQKSDDSLSKVKGEYHTYMDDKATLRGWKRYPVRPKPSTRDSRSSNDKVNTQFHPLPAGCRFRGQVHFHNLRPVELGALIWCLTLGGKDGVCHSIGMAKPYGFGAITITPELQAKALNPEFSGSVSAESLMTAFASFMATTCSDENWADSDYLEEFFAMAHPANANASSLDYPQLGGPKGTFANLKKEKSILPWYSELVTGQKASIREPVITNERDTALEVKLEAIAAEAGNKAPFAKGDIVESVKIEKVQKKHKETWWVHFECGGNAFKGNLTPEAKAILPSEFDSGKRYRFKIRSFSERKPSENILLDFADNPPAPID
jgi:CRISPR-associated protein (TIGR03986 family)